MTILKNEDLRLNSGINGVCSKVGSVFVVSNGCPENRMDVARAERYLVENGWTINAGLEDADLILFNACGRSSKTESYSIGIIKEIQSKMRSDQQLIVWGCLPKIDLEGLRKEYGGQVSLGSELPELQKTLGLQTSIDGSFANYLGPVWPMSKSNAPDFLRYEGSRVSQTLKRAAICWDDYLNSRFNLVRSKDPSVFYIKISTGCMNKCAYCAVRLARGRTRSKPLERVVSEFKLGLQKGYRKFSLMGTDPGSYGVDLGCNLMDLLWELTGLEGDFRIFLRNFHPGYVKKMQSDFIEVLKTKKIKYVEIASESGSNRVLNLMNRNYTIEEYKRLVETLRVAHPPLIIRTQVIAGFPTETEEEFEQTLKLLDDVAFDYVEVYEFSARPGTAAAVMEPQVPDAVKRQRFLRLYRKAVLNRTPRKVKNILLNRM
ncbi:MAG: radical SAM protein [Candidatus Bathyarchaeota archaeon]|nr:radical SAM protein [Candidatus Bathyarchaeota archaeon]